MIDYVKVGKRVRYIRKSAKLNQKELSRMLGVTAGFVSRLERAELRVGLDPIYKISIVFRCDVNWLLWGDKTGI